MGTGVVGLELAQALHRLGVRVRLFGRSRKAGPLTDPAAPAAVTAWLQTALPYSASAADLSPHREGESVVVEWRDETQTRRSERFDYLLAAAGRLQLAGLDLDKAGIPWMKRAFLGSTPRPAGSATSRRSSSPVTRTTIAPSP